MLNTWLGKSALEKEIKYQIEIFITKQLVLRRNEKVILFYKVNLRPSTIYEQTVESSELYRWNKYL